MSYELQLAYLTSCLMPIHDRHLDIHENEVVAMPFIGCYGLLPVFGEVNPVACFLEDKLGNFSIYLEVVRYENAQGFRIICLGMLVCHWRLILLQ